MAYDAGFDAVVPYAGVGADAMRGLTQDMMFSRGAKGARATALLAVLEPNLLAKPATVMMNKVTIKGANQAVQMFGPAQAAVAKAVADSVADGIIPQADAEGLVCLVGVFIHWEAKDNKKIYDYNYRATKESIARAMKGEPNVKTVIERREKAKHPFA